MSAALLLLGLKWALAWFIYTPEGVLVTAGTAEGFSNQRACVEFARAQQELAEPNDLAWACRPMQVLPPVAPAAKQGK